MEAVMKVPVSQYADGFDVKILRPGDPGFDEAAAECEPPRVVKSDAPRPLWFEGMRRGR
jgi:hypothetical protein